MKSLGILETLQVSVLIALILAVPRSQSRLYISITGSFEECEDCIFVNNTINYIQWGSPTVGENRSGLEFLGSTNVTLAPEQRLQTGSLLHHNWPIRGNIPETVELVLSIVIWDDEDLVPKNSPSTSNFSYTLRIYETSNRATGLEDGICEHANDSGWFGLYNSSMVCCPYYTPEVACSDKISFLTPFDVDKTLFIDETEYTLKIEGFVNEPVYEVVEDFITQEKEVNSGVVYAELVAVCAANATCDDGNQCTFDECLDGFCFHNTSTYEGKACGPDETPNSLANTWRMVYRFLTRGISEDEKCYEYRCHYGECIKIEENCTNPSSSSSSSSLSDDGDGGDDDDDNELLAPILGSALAALCLLCCLLPCLFLPFLLCPLLLFLLKDASIPTSVATRAMDPTELESIATNPTYNPVGTTGGNPLYE